MGKLNIGDIRTIDRWRLYLLHSSGIEHYQFSSRIHVSCYYEVIALFRKNAIVNIPIKSQYDFFITAANVIAHELLELTAFVSGVVERRTVRREVTRRRTYIAAVWGNKRTFSISQVLQVEVVIVSCDQFSQGKISAIRGNLGWEIAFFITEYHLPRITLS